MTNNDHTTTNPCRLCGNEITNGRGKYRTADGLVCFDCLRGMDRGEKKAQEVVASRWTAEESEREYKELKEQEYRDTQAAIVELLVPLSGPRRAASRDILDKIKIALKERDPLERALKVNSLIRAASPAIEAGIRDLQRKTQSGKGPDATGDPIEGGR